MLSLPSIKPFAPEQVKLGTLILVQQPKKICLTISWQHKPQLLITIVFTATTSKEIKMRLSYSMTHGAQQKVSLEMNSLE